MVMNSGNNLCTKKLIHLGSPLNLKSESYQSTLAPGQVQERSSKPLQGIWIQCWIKFTILGVGGYGGWLCKESLATLV